MWFKFCLRKQLWIRVQGLERQPIKCAWYQQSFCEGRLSRHFNYPRFNIVIPTKPNLGHFIFALQTGDHYNPCDLSYKLKTELLLSAFTLRVGKRLKIQVYKKTDKWAIQGSRSEKCSSAWTGYLLHDCVIASKQMTSSLFDVELKSGGSRGRTRHGDSGSQRSIKDAHIVSTSQDRLRLL